MDIAFSHDERYIAVGISIDLQLYEFDGETFLEMPQGFDGWFEQVAWSPTGYRLAVLENLQLPTPIDSEIQSYSLHVWDVIGERFLISDIPVSDVFHAGDVRFSPDGQHIALIVDWDAYIFDAGSGALLHSTAYDLEPRIRGNPVSPLGTFEVISPELSFISEPPAFQIIEITTEQPVLTLEDQTDGLFFAGWGNEDATVWGYSYGHCISFAWDIETGDVVDASAGCGDGPGYGRGIFRSTKRSQPLALIVILLIQEIPTNASPSLTIPLIGIMRNPQS